MKSPHTGLLSWVFLLAAFRLVPAAGEGAAGQAPEIKAPAARPAVYVRKPDGPVLRLVRRALVESPHRYSEAEKRRLALEFTRASRRLGLDPSYLVALVAVESHFRPYIIRRNSNGTHDIGLTQQNSRYVQIRCRRTFGRRCSPDELKNPVVSLRLMEATLERCGRAFRAAEARLLCYNSWRRAYAFRRSGRPPAYLRKIRLMRAKITTTPA